MAETQTPNYKWIKPDIGGDASTWGNVLNTTIDAVDSVVWANQQAGVPIGSIIMFAGSTSLPPNWLQAVGQVLDTTAYAALFAVIGYTYGGSGTSFNVPNLIARFPLGQTNFNLPGATGGEATHILAAAEMPSHAHGVSDPTHVHSAYQNAHSHGITTGGHSHGVNDPGHVHGGVLNVVGVPGWNSQGSASPLIAQTSTSTAVTNISIQAVGNVGGNTDPQAPGVGVNAAGTGISIQNAGSGAAHNNLPPYLQLNFIIRYI